MGITINGKTITTNGGSIQVGNGKIIIDGVDMTPDSKEINIEVIGNVDLLEIDTCSKVKITGDAKTVKSHNGNIDIGGNISGDVSTHNGNINCANVGGSVTTRNGNIKHRS
jgi:hypothetical protein